MRVIKIFICALFMTGCAKPELSLPILSQAVAKSKDHQKIAALSAPNKMEYIRKKKNLRLKKMSFSDLPGWENDNHHEAMKAFLISCKQILRTRTRSSVSTSRRPTYMSKACILASKLSKAPDRKTSRRFFETYFVPYKVQSRQKKGLLTGYYEPEILGSLTKTDKFKLPIYRPPSNHVNLSARSGVGRKLGGLVAGQKTKNGIKPLPTRKEIDLGALDGKGLELVYLQDPIDVFFMHIQGSGRIRLTDGSVMRLGFHAKNGYPYSSIGKYMIKNGLVPAAGMSLDAVKNYLRKDMKRGQKILWVNKSYIFFRKLNNRQSKQGGPIGAMQVPLTAGRSLAVDTRYHDLGIPIYVVSDNMKHHGTNGFRRLMVAQDVGSAIKGTQRGDIFWGTGDEAGKIAGNTGNNGYYYILLPKNS